MSDVTKLHEAVRCGDLVAVLSKGGSEPSQRPSRVRWAERRADGSSSRMPPWRNGGSPRTRSVRTAAWS